MTDIQAKLKEIGPFVEGADDNLLVCRCEEVTKGQIRKAVHEGNIYIGRNEKIFEIGNGTLSGADLWKNGKINYCI